MADFSDLGFEEEIGFEEDRAPQAVDSTAPTFTPRSDEERLDQGEAAAWAAGQGLTLGFFDELLGALGAGAEATTTENKFKDLYPEYRDAARKLFSKAEEEHPGTTIAGELAGGLALPVAAVGKLSKGAGYGAKVADAALSGGVVGAITGAGVSEEEKTADILSDAGKSGLMGASIGGLAQGVIAPAAKFSTDFLKSQYKNSPVLQRIAEAYDVGKANPDILEETGRKRIAGAYTKAVEENIVPLLDDDLSRLGRSAYQQAKDVAESQGRTVDLSKIITDLKANDFKYTPAARFARDTVANDIVDTLTGGASAEIKEAVKADLKKVLNGKVELDAFMENIQDITESTTLTPEEAFKMRNKLQDLIGGLQDVPERDARIALKNMRNNLDNVIKSEEGLGIDLDKLDDEYRAITKFKSEMRHDVGGKSGVKAHDKSEVTAREALKSRFLKAHRDKGGDIAAQTESAFKELKDSGVIDALDVDARLAKVDEAVKARSVADDLYGMMGMPSSDLGLIQNLGLAMRSRLTQTVAGTGKAMSELEKSAAYKGANKILSMTEEQLRTVAQTVAQKNPTMAKTIASIADKPISKRKALLFTAMQQPAFREAFSDSEAKPEEDGE